jgi:formylglycine-generating enzyme required for sulfatase activity
MLGIVLALPCLLVSAPVQEGPPGLVLVKGGRTKIGTPKEAASKLIEEREGMKDYLAAETPLFTLEVEDFYLMPTEVTNEQFAAYVKAPGNRAKPPRSWGIEALQAAQAQYLLDQGKARQEAKQAGKPFENKLFDADKWWDENWESVSWKVPAGDETKPVVYTNHADAEAYAHWAGLRLMTEAEFQRAARENSDRVYPWGDEWAEGKCLSLSNSKSEPVAVGSFPDGAVNGIFDLVGNVWEWTSTPYDAFPGYEAFKVKVKGPPKREIQGLAPFDPNQRVVVGGSFQMEPVGLRIAIRKNSDRDQSTIALGFRCAASTRAGADMAAWMSDRELKLSTLPKDVELQHDNVVALRRWQTEPGTVKVPG